MTDRQKRRAEARKLAKRRNSLHVDPAFASDQNNLPQTNVTAVSPAATQVKSQISPAQLAANQANAQLSTGPKTEEGIAISARNNFQHGLTQTEGDLILLESESKEDYAKSLKSFQAEWKPTTATESDLVERLVNSQWLRRRALRLQKHSLAPDGRILDEKQFALYHRYETKHERAFNKALADLIRLRSLYLREKNGFESQKRKDEIQAFKIRALKDREYRNQLAKLEAEARLTLAQHKLAREQPADITPSAAKTEEIAFEAH